MCPKLRLKLPSQMYMVKAHKYMNKLGKYLYIFALFLPKIVMFLLTKVETSAASFSG